MSDKAQSSGKEPDRHNPHDAAFKSAFQKKELAVSFFQTHLPAGIVRHIDFDSTEIVGKSYVDENMKELHSDIVYKVRMRNRDAFLYLLFEHQSTPDHWMIFRLLCYMINLWKSRREQHPKKRHLPVIIPLVLYHGKRRWKAPVSFTELFTDAESFRMFIPDFACRVYDLGKYEDEAIIRLAKPALDVVLYVFRHIFDTDFEENVIRKLAALLSEIEDYREFSEFWNWAFRYACEARHGDKEKLVAAITGATENIRDERVKMAAMTIAEQFRQEGRNEGRNEGIQIGMEEGMLIGMEEGEKKTLFRLLKKRFGNISPIIEEKLKFSKKDILDRFTDSIFDFRDLSDAEKWWELNDAKIRPQ